MHVTTAESQAETAADVDPVARPEPPRAESRGTVCIIEDEEELRSSLQFLLESAGYTVVAYSSAEPFLHELDDDRADCVIIDVRLPRMSGLDLQRELKRRGVNLPVIISTGYADVPTAVRAFKNGALDFLEKPLDEESLLARIREGVTRHRRARERRAEIEAIRKKMGSLTPREKEVMELVVQGNANKQVAARLGLSEKTIEVHRANVMRKLQAGSVANLVRMSCQLEKTP